MRPTQLNYRNPTEKTSEFRSSNINHKGEIVDFNFKKQKKLISLSPVKDN
jgi:hypothetical protein